MCYIAIKISKYLDLPFCVNQALEHWAICKIESTTNEMTDEVLVQVLREKILKFSTDFSYAKIARCAQKRSIDLAKLLLNYEPRSKIQINSLIEFEQFEIALKKALISKDINLINQALIELIGKYYDSTTWNKLFELIYINNEEIKQLQRQNESSSPYQVNLNNVLINTFTNLLMKEDKSNEKYKKILAKFLKSSNNDEFAIYQQSNLSLMARSNLRKSLTLLQTGNIGLGDINETGDDTKECLGYLEQSTRSFEKLRNKFNVQMCSDLKRLIIFQKQFDKKQLISSGGINDNNNSAYNNSPIQTLGLSINDTISVMLDVGDTKFAEKIKKEMFVTDKRWWYLLMNSYINNKQYDKLSTYIDKNSSSRRPPPIGYLPIIELYLEAEQKEYAKKYILKLSDIDEKLEWLCQLKFWDEAVNVAANDKDFDALQTIRANCNDAKVVKRINDILKTLG